ncbi:MAG: tungstate ABC transporter substrate-binding protein WtpA [Dehalococcoidales bacterium]
MNMKKFTSCLLSILVITTSLLAAGCAGGEDNKRLVIFEAGSLLVPFLELEAAFEDKYPDIDVVQEGHGSIQVIRHVTEIHDEIDIAIVADHSLIPLLMYNTMQPDSSEPYASWTIGFATNNFGFAYRPDSLYADEINQENWYEVLSRDDVRLGMADPRLDASGYRALMLCQFANMYYERPDIFYNIISRNINGPIRVNPDGDGYRITVPEIISSKRDNFYFRGFTVQLISLLEAGQIDYAFMYKSMAQQQGFEFLDLPPQVDMSSEEMAQDYAKVVVHIDFRRFASVTPIFGGEPIIYGLTIPENANNPEEAELFIQFLLSQEGQAILEKNSQPVIPPVADNKDKVPEALRELVE